MSAPTYPPPRSKVSQALSHSRLGVPAVIFFVMSAIAPMMVVGGAVTTAFAVTGLTGIPFAFFIVALVLAVFSVGYVAMSRHISNAGAFYTYIAHGLWRPAGVGASLVAAISYNALQIALYGGLGVAGSGLIEAKTGVALPWWVVALAAWVVVAAFGLMRVDLNGKVLAVLVAVEMVVLVVYDVSFVGNPSAEGLSFTTLAPSNLFQGGIGAALVLAITGFIGFEGAAVFSEESKNPRRTVPIATYVTLGLMALLYGLSSWLMSVATGPSHVVERSQKDSVDLIFNLAAERLGDGFLIDAGRVLFLTSLVAALMSFHNTVARYLFALGREGVLPRALGRTGHRTGAPVTGSLVQSSIALVVILLYTVTGTDPLVKLFFWGGMFGGFGVLFMLAVTSFAVIGYFARDPRGEGLWSRLLAPGAAGLLLVVVLFLAVDNFATLLGPPVTPDSTVAWLLPAVFPAAMFVGVLWALWLRAGRPHTYATIGFGANASVSQALAAATGSMRRLAPEGGLGD